MSKLEFTKPEIAYIKSKLYFSDREEEVLDMWLRDYTNKEIAEEISVSVSTVVRIKTKITNKIMKVL